MFEAFPLLFNLAVVSSAFVLLKLAAFLTFFVLLKLAAFLTFFVLVRSIATRDVVTTRNVGESVVDFTHTAHLS